MSILTPKSEQELSEMIAGATEPLAIRGGGSRSVDLSGQGLSTNALSGIMLYEPGALTMVARSGTPLTEIEATLDAEGQMLAFEPFAMGDGSTIGGVFATNASGARRIQVGAARDFLLGVRFVDGAGNIVKNGGRVMKNVTGYDLVKLMAGSYGTLGVLSEVSFKVLPKPECVGTLQIEGLRDAEAVAAMSSAMNTPYDVNGAVHLTSKGGQRDRTLIRVEGFEGSVRHRIEKLKLVLGKFGEVDEVDGADWEAFRRLQMFASSPAALWKIGIKPSDAGRFVAGISKDYDFQPAFDWAGGRIWVGANEAAAMESKMQDESSLDPKSGFEGLHTHLQKLAAHTSAHATLMKSQAPLNVPRFQPESPGIATLSQGIRARFDPKRILNPGVMG